MTRSVIGMTVSCSSNEQSAGIDGSNNTKFPWFVWISFKFPDAEPVQIRVPVLGKEDTPEGSPGHNNKDIAGGIANGMESAYKAGQITQAQYYDAIQVESTEVDNAKGGKDGQSYYLRVTLEGVESIDGGTDCPKIRIAGIAGKWERRPVGLGIGKPAAPEEIDTKLVPLPLPPNPGGTAPGKKGAPCECREDGQGTGAPSPKKTTIPEAKDESQGFKDVMGEPTGAPGWRNHG